jgi:hypothetical protein
MEGCVAMRWGVYVGGGGGGMLLVPRVRCGINKKLDFSKQKQRTQGMQIRSKAFD